MAASCTLVCCGEERDDDKAVIGDYIPLSACLYHFTTKLSVLVLTEAGSCFNL